MDATKMTCAKFDGVGYLQSPFIDCGLSNKQLMYSTYLHIPRQSGVVDTVPLFIHDNKLLDMGVDLLNGDSLMDELVHVVGRIKTRRDVDPETQQRHLRIFIHVDMIEFASEFTDENNRCEITGYICKPVTYRKTPYGKEITDMWLAVNHVNQGISRSSAYIPMILWNALAVKFANAEVGQKMEIVGRFQSRIYTKDNEDHTVFEVSVSKAICLDDELNELSDDSTESN